MINATGVWTDSIQDMVGRADLQVRASKGIHLIVRREKVPSHTGLILRTEKSVLFVIPWGVHWIIGTTDTDWDLDLAHPAASRRDIDYLLSRLNELLVDPLEPEDIVGVYAGLRPLLHGEAEATSKLCREHAVSEPVPSFFTVAGGKYTTYRVMAADTVDAVCERLGRQHRIGHRPDPADRRTRVGAGPKPPSRTGPHPRDVDRRGRPSARTVRRRGRRDLRPDRGAIPSWRHRSGRSPVSPGRDPASGHRTRVRCT